MIYLFCFFSRSFYLFNCYILLIFSICSFLFFNKSILYYQLLFTIYHFFFFNVSFILGLDFLSYVLSSLTIFLLSLCFLFHWYLRYQFCLYVFFLFLSFFFFSNAFLSLDFLFFYIFFEGLVIPMFFIIGSEAVESVNYMQLINYLFILCLVQFSCCFVSFLFSLVKVQVLQIFFYILIFSKIVNFFYGSHCLLVLL